MKKPKKSTLRNKLDKIWSLIIRSKGKCQRCKKKENLQAAHIFGRRFLNTRWLLDNGLCLCPDCHINFAHQQPILFAEFVKKTLGEEKYEALKEAHNQITKYTIEDLQIKLKILTEMLNE
jgi:5-methylcytosine-specific restriction endonuclease McrA